MKTKAEILTMPTKQLIALAREEIEFYGGRIDASNCRDEILDHITDALIEKGITNLKGWVYQKVSDEESDHSMHDQLYLLEGLAQGYEIDQLPKSVNYKTGEKIQFSEEEIFNALFWDEQF